MDHAKSKRMWIRNVCPLSFEWSSNGPDMKNGHIHNNLMVIILKYFFLLFRKFKPSSHASNKNYPHKILIYIEIDLEDLCKIRVTSFAAFSAVRYFYEAPQSVFIWVEFNHFTLNFILYGTKFFVYTVGITRFWGTKVPGVTPRQVQFFCGEENFIYEEYNFRNSFLWWTRCFYNNSLFWSLAFGEILRIRP